MILTSIKLLVTKLDSKSIKHRLQKQQELLWWGKEERYLLHVQWKQQNIYLIDYHHLQFLRSRFMQPSSLMDNFTCLYLPMKDRWEKIDILNPRLRKEGNFTIKRISKKRKTSYKKLGFERVVFPLA